MKRSKVNWATLFGCLMVAYILSTLPSILIAALAYVLLGWPPVEVGAWALAVLTAIGTWRSWRELS